MTIGVVYSRRMSDPIKTTQIQFRLDAELKRKLQKLAKQNGVSVSDLIRLPLEKAVRGVK
jgi:antitoxin component of RelBE/YafQ-DinJ toxin-antitoxin module